MAVMAMEPVAIGPYSDQTSLLFILFSLPCGPWENTVYLTCCLPHSLTQSSLPPLPASPTTPRVGEATGLTSHTTSLPDHSVRAAEQWSQIAATLPAVTPPTP